MEVSSPANYTPLSLESFNPSSRGKKSKIKIVFFVILASFFFIFFALFGAVSLAVYGDVKIPFLSQTQIQTLKIQFAYLPFLPKTKDQILLAAFQRAKGVKSFSYDSSFSGQLSFGGAASNFPFIFDITSKGFISGIGKKAVVSDTVITGMVNFTGKKYKGSIRIANTGKKVYVKLENLPKEILAQTQLPRETKEKIFNTWVVWDSSGLKSESRDILNVEVNKDKSFKGLYNQLIEALLDKDILSKLTLQTGSGKNPYQVSADFTPDEIIRMVKKAYLKEGKTLTKDEIKSLDMAKDIVKSVKIGAVFTKNFYLRKASIVVRMEGNLASIYGQSKKSITNLTPGFLPLNGDVNLDFAAALVLSDYNTKKTFTPPKETISFEELMGLVFQPQIYNSGQGSQVSSRIDDRNKKIKLTLLDNALLRYYAIKHTYPSDLNDLLNKGEISLSQLEEAKEYQIKYETNADRSDYLLYVQIEKKNGEDKKRYLIFNKEVEVYGEAKEVSEEELNQYRIKLGRDVLGVYSSRWIEELLLKIKKS